MASPVIDSGQFYRVAVNQVTSEQIQLDDATSAWQNLVATTDVDGNGDSTVFDALLVITEAGVNAYSDSATAVLNDPLSVGVWPDTYFDVNRDGKVTPLDALQILNLLAVIGDAEGEADLALGGVRDAAGEALQFAVLPWLDPALSRQETALMRGENVDSIHGACLPLDSQSAAAIGFTPEPLATQDLANANSDLLSSELEIWADRVDQLLSGELGFSE